MQMHESERAPTCIKRECFLSEYVCVCARVSVRVCMHARARTSPRKTVGGEACPAPLRSTYKHNNKPSWKERHFASFNAESSLSRNSLSLSVVLYLLIRPFSDGNHRVEDDSRESRESSRRNDVTVTPARLIRVTGNVKRAREMRKDRRETMRGSEQRQRFTLKKTAAGISLRNSIIANYARSG